MNDTECGTELSGFDSITSWYTDEASGYFVPLSFKFGLYLGIQLSVINSQRDNILKRKLGRIPLILQITWLINVILWSSSFFTQDEEMQYWLPVSSNIFDLTTKFLVIYFICVRMIVLSNLQNRFVNILCKALIFMGFTLSVLGVIAEFIKENITEETYNFLNLFYPITDAFISVIEIISLYIFISYKYDCPDCWTVWGVLRSTELTIDSIVVLGSALISFTMMILKLSLERDIDYDLNFINIIAALKYSSSCNVAVAVFKKTVKSGPALVLSMSPEKQSGMGTVNGKSKAGLSISNQMESYIKVEPKTSK